MPTQIRPAPTHRVALRIVDHREGVEPSVVPFANPAERAAYVAGVRRTIEARADENNSGRVTESVEDGILTLHIYPLDR